MKEECVKGLIFSLRNHEIFIIGFCKKKLFLHICKFFFAKSKSTAEELSNDVPFVIFGHQSWEGGGASILGFKYPSRARVKLYMSKGTKGTVKI